MFWFKLLFAPEIKMHINLIKFVLLFLISLQTCYFFLLNTLK